MARDFGRRTLLATAGTLAVPSRGLAQPSGADLARIAVFDQNGPVADIALGGHPYWAAFFDQLRALGHHEGETIAIDRWSAGGTDDDGGPAAVDRVPTRICGGRGLDGIWAGPRPNLPPTGQVSRPRAPWRRARRNAGRAADRFDLLVNLRTARALGITLPLEIMLLATEVIE